MHSIFILLLLTTLVFSSPLDQQWKRWKDTHQKIYSDAEEHHRRLIWEDNLKKVQEHNIKADLGLSTYWLGMNKFADLTVNEFSKMIGATKVHNHLPSNKYRPEYTRNPSVKLPDTVDWRQKGYVTPIKDQRECTGGWAFSATGAVEGQHFNATGQLISLSEQNLIDCSDKQGNIGCVGGQATQAFEYIKENGGIDTEDSYPFEDDVNRCRFKSESVAANLTGYVTIKSKNESALQEAIAMIGPVAVNIDSSHDSFQLYKQGIYHELFCSQVTLDHGMLAIGYGTDSGKEYWLVKNSFGVGWGEQGYIRMTRNKRNECGIATAASYPLV